MEPSLIRRIAIMFRKELRSNRDSLIYWELETFVGCLLAESVNSGLITKDEEQELRRRILNG